MKHHEFLASSPSPAAMGMILAHKSSPAELSWPGLGDKVPTRLSSFALLWPFQRLLIMKIDKLPLGGAPSSQLKHNF
jgi:hypothetical protein